MRGLTVTTLLATTACGFQSSQLSESGPKEQLHFTIMGGNSSCRDDGVGNARSPIGNGVYNSFHTMLADINADHRFSVKWTVSCHPNNNATVYYATSETGTQVQQASIEQFVQNITTNPAPDTQDPVFFAGHSYGGWLTMKAAMAATEEQQFAGIYTIDPISRVHCTFTNPAGCTSAPRDFNADHRAFIRDHSDYWANFYQTQTFYLHSAAMGEADENLKLNTSHTEIDAHPEVWEKIRAQVRIRLALLN
jgi:predicted alpha/beta hydrolase family esterase